MIELTSSDLEHIKCVEIEILKEIARICKNHGLHYSLTGGTLLGAIRHKGFIPWDDDIDIVMPYDDYIQFLEYAKTEMQEQFFVENVWTDDHFGYLPMTKIMATNTKMIEINANRCKAKSGIFVDVFPLYNTSESSFVRRIDFWVIQRLAKALRCRNDYYFEQTGIKRIIYSIRSKVYKKIPLSFFKGIFLLIINRNLENKRSTYVVSYGGVYGIKKETFPRKWFEDFTELEFENIHFEAMILWKPYLDRHYGDYMKLPPVEKRIPHHYLEKYENCFFIKED